MKKHKKSYWEKRAADRMVEYMADAERTANTLGKAYYSVGQYLSDEAAKILKSFTDTFGLSEAEARRLISNTPEKSITEKLKKALPKIADGDKRRQAEAFISSPAYSYRIKRLENLGNNVRKQCYSLYNTEIETDMSFFRGLCDDAYKHCIFDMQKGMGISSAFDVMPTSRIKSILSTKWSGEHYSVRVWGNTNALADGLQNDMLVGIMSGKSEKQMAEDIMNRCAVGAFEARRLVRTEACYIANQAELDGYKQTDIEKYEFSAVLDSHTSDLCQSLDGKTFDVAKAVPGKNLPPMHPFCRSTTLPGLPSEEELDREIAELSDEIGADVDFEEWKENLQETEDGRLVYRAKSVDKSGESGIIKNIELPFDTDEIRSMSSKTRKLISEAFDKVIADYNIELDELVTKPLGAKQKNVPFQFQPVCSENGSLIKRIVINSEYDFMGSQEDFQRRIMRNFNNGVLASNSIDGLIAHEMAHVMTFQGVSTYSGFLFENKRIAKIEVLGISRYADASLDGAEHIAEAFAAKRCGIKVSEEAQLLLDQYIERWKK